MAGIIPTKGPGTMPNIEPLRFKPELHRFVHRLVYDSITPNAANPKLQFIAQFHLDKMVQMQPKMIHLVNAVLQRITEERRIHTPQSRL